MYPSLGRRLALFSALVAFSFPLLLPQGSVLAQPQVHHQITWDQHSLMIDGRRILLYSGEFHYSRLPSVSQWTDRLEKMKAAGLNGVSIYFDWAYHSSAPGQYDFSGIRDVDRLLTITDQLGLYVIARVGPYMNGEADAGGLPGWLLTKQLFLRSQSWNPAITQPTYSPAYLQYAKEWYDHLLPILARHQVTDGGSVLLLQIENEYGEIGGSAAYMQALYQYARDGGIKVPIFHNDFYLQGDWSHLVDLYAFDSYPYGFDCCHQWWDLHFTGIDTWEQTVRNQLHITTPMMVAELQGGSFDHWGGKGYDAVAQTLNGDWLSALDESALAQGTTMLNTYMFVGGTNWGYQSEPEVYTSYDYGAPISESGTLRPSYYAAHRLGMFLQTYGRNLAGADAAPSLAQAREKTVVVHSRVDPSSGQDFIFLRHGDAGNSIQTSLKLALLSGTINVPQQPKTAITLPGHGSALLTANVQTGPLHMAYSTSSVLTDLDTAQGNYLVLYGPDGSDGETQFDLPAGLSPAVVHNADVTVTRTASSLRLNYTHTAEPRTVDIQTPTGTLHLIITTADAAGNYWFDNGLLISGAALVTDDNGQTKIWEDKGQQAVAYGAENDRSLVIDGQNSALPDPTTGSTLLGSLAGSGQPNLPTLSTWKFQPEAPEVSASFDDTGWQIADHTTTPNPNITLQGPSLLADDYGFHYGFVWYRGHFTATGRETGITISARHSYAVYLNGIPIGQGDSNLLTPPHSYATPATFKFPASALHPDQDNVVAVLTESLGHDEGWVGGPAAQSPQGLLTAAVTGTKTSILWRIQGDHGGETPSDTTRGLMNASGLYGERNGWYQPGFDDSTWQGVSLPDSWKTRGVTSTIGWYRTHFQLNVDTREEVPIGLTIPHASDKAVIWLNGWQLGRYWEQQGPQHEFYLPAGILNGHGDNVLAIAVWNRGHAGGLTSVPHLWTHSVLQSHTLSIGAQVPLQSTGFWHTQGNRIVDDRGLPVRIAAVNWFGMENVYFVPAGLDHQPLAAIVARIRQLGFNTIRLPFSNQLVEQNPVVSYGLNANPDLQGLHALDLLDRIIAAAAAQGLRVILDDASSEARTGPESNGLWYTPQYPESAWIQDWQTLVQRYQDNPTVIGVDLRNEPHTGPPGPWSVKAYLKQGSTWGPYKGVDNPATDWHLAAEKAGDAVLAINPHLLIFVEGLQLYPDPTQPGGVDSYWWGGILQPAKLYPVELSVPHQLVYSPHEYGPLKWQMAWFGKTMTYKSMAAIWLKHWDFLEKSSFAGQAPIFLGEFGTCGAKNCIEDSTPGSQGAWFSILIDYLRRRPEIGWAFWAVNGTNHVGNPTPGYVLKPDWHSVVSQTLINTFHDIELAPGP